MSRSPRVVGIERLPSPLGPLELLTSGSRVLALSFSSTAGWRARALPGVEPVGLGAPSRAAEAVEAYFGGELEALDALELELLGTPFQTSVWRALRAVPAGRATTYGALARALGRPSAGRAVGAANGANPVALICPCHRVIGEGNALTGYAAGLERKRWLLEHEGFLPRQGSLW